MTLVATILGCGSSGGVPRVGGGWGDCDPDEPRNRRRRCSLLLERITGDKRTTVLVDTGPDLREQLLDAQVSWVDGVLYTHEHADHTHGIDDLRVLAINKGRRVDIFADDQTATMLRTRFGYCFETPPGSNYPPIIDLHRLDTGEIVRVSGEAAPISALPFGQDHGDVKSLGFRIGNLAYSSDINGLNEKSIAILEGIDIWIVDALRHSPHPSHWCLSETLEWIARLKPRRAILTNMHTDMDYHTLCHSLPTGVEPAYDGMKISFAG